MNYKKIVYVSLFALLLIGVIIYFVVGNDKPKDKMKTELEEGLNSESVITEYDDESEKIDWSNMSSTSINLSGEEITIVGEGAVKNSTQITISKSGIYNLSGSLNDGNIIIDGGNTKISVKLVFDGVTIKSEANAPIYVIKAKLVDIELKDKTINTLTDSNNYSLDNDEESVNAVIYSKADLIIEGTGTLNINANYNDAIASKDNIIIKNGNINIKSVDDGIRGKDYLIFQNGTINIDSIGDAIKTTSTETDLGYILIENGNFNIVSMGDGIDSTGNIVIKGGNFDIKTGGGSVVSSKSDNWGIWGNKKTTTNTASAKGIKSDTNIIISNAEMIFNTSDDAIHCNSKILIESGTFNISSGDDGIHADTSLTIDNGKINITQSYEGLESANIQINNGMINIVASDDGINVAGGNDSSSMGGRPGQNGFTNNTSQKLIINNGTLYVNADGDGLDANGSIYINFGTIYVDGPTSNGNGALDYDGELVMTGGTLIAAGSSGMLQTISDVSTTYSIVAAFNSMDKDSTINLKDSSNNIVLSYTPAKTYTSVVIASPLIKKSETYTLTIDSTNVGTVKINNIVNSIGEVRSNNMPGGNPPKRR